MHVFATEWVSQLAKQEEVHGYGLVLVIQDPWRVHPLHLIAWLGLQSFQSRTRKS